MNISREAKTDTTPVVFVVDSDSAVRVSLETTIRTAGWTPRMFGSIQEFISCQRTPTPGCVVLDPAFPDSSVLDLEKLIAERLELPVIVITALPDVPMTVQLMKAGAFECLLKPLMEDTIRSAISSAIEVSRFATRQTVRVDGLRQRHASLSQREREVMTLVVQGRLNKLIAVALGIAEITVKIHRGNMMRKMGASSIAHLVKMAAELDRASNREPWHLRPASAQHFRLRFPGPVDGFAIAAPEGSHV